MDLPSPATLWTALMRAIYGHGRLLAVAVAMVGIGVMIPAADLATSLYLAVPHLLLLHWLLPPYLDHIPRLARAITWLMRILMFAMFLLATALFLVGNDTRGLQASIHDFVCDVSLAPASWTLDGPFPALLDCSRPFGFAANLQEELSPLPAIVPISFTHGTGHVHHFIAEASDHIENQAKRAMAAEEDRFRSRTGDPTKVEVRNKRHLVKAMALRAARSKALERLERTKVALTEAYAALTSLPEEIMATQAELRSFMAQLRRDWRGDPATWLSPRTWLQRAGVFRGTLMAGDVERARGVLKRAQAAQANLLARINARALFELLDSNGFCENGMGMERTK